MNVYIIYMVEMITLEIILYKSTDMNMNIIYSKALYIFIYKIY